MALFFGAVNIKDYFWYKEGISFTIADEQKPGLYRNMRRVLKAGDSLPALIGATIVMSAGASLVEFSCTAGFPVLWTNLLVAQGATALTFVALLALYMLIYQIDELGIFLAAVFSMRASRLEEKHGRILKLIGGTLMLTLAGVMLINPNLMSEIGNSLLVFAVAFAAALVVLLVHRVILPRFGVRIGSEAAGPKPRKGMLVEWLAGGPDLPRVEEGRMLIEHYDLEIFTPPCDPGAERFSAKARLMVDISAVLPYLNATLRGAVYTPAAAALIWKKAGHNIAFHAYEIGVSNVEDRDAAVEGIGGAGGPGQPHLGAPGRDHARPCDAPAADHDGGVQAVAGRRTAGNAASRTAGNSPCG